MARSEITTKINVGHARTLALVMTDLLEEHAIDLDTYSRDEATAIVKALNALSHATAGPVWGDPLRKALEKIDAYGA